MREVVCEIAPKMLVGNGEGSEHRGCALRTTCAVDNRHKEHM